MTGLDIDRLAAALVDQDQDELEASVPDALPVDHPGPVAALPERCLSPRSSGYLAATLAHVAAAAAEGGVEMTRLLLQGS